MHGMLSGGCCITIWTEPPARPSLTKAAIPTTTAPTTTSVQSWEMFGWNERRLKNGYNQFVADDAVAAKVISMLKNGKGIPR